MRIVSLLPSATEILHELGAEDSLVAVSEDCDFPPGTEDLPSVTSSSIDTTGSSREIDEAVKDTQHSGTSIYHLDEERLEEFDPDLVLTQEQCEVCAPSFDEVRETCRLLEGDPDVISLEAHSLSDILDNILTLGEFIGRRAEARRAVRKFRDRRRRLTRTADQTDPGRKVLCLEWLDPPYVAGHWVPEMVEALGGRPLGQPGEPSREVDYGTVREFDPELVLLMPCGFELDRTVEEGRSWLESPGSKPELSSLAQSVFALDGSSYFSRPGPRVYQGLAVLKQILSASVEVEGQVPENAFVRLV